MEKVKKLRMLIVDDEIFSRDAVMESIDWYKYGLEVFGTATGEEALERMSADPVEILMTDIRMPGMDGLQLIAELHRRDIWPGIIVLSSFNEFDLVRSAMRLGAEDYLFKPTMMPDDILDAVLKVKKRYEDRAVQGGYRENRENDGSLLERTVRQVIAERRKTQEKSGNNERLKREVREALEYIAGHLGDRELLLSKVAAHVGMSKTYFSRLFKESMGETFVNYVTGLRMECARRLYLETDMKVYEIAELVGYSDWHYFYSLYRKTFGHSLSREKNH